MTSDDLYGYGKRLKEVERLIEADEAVRDGDGKLIESFLKHIKAKNVSVDATRVGTKLMSLVENICKQIGIDEIRLERSIVSSGGMTTFSATRNTRMPTTTQTLEG